MMAGSPSAEVAAVEKLRDMFIDDNAILIDSRAEDKMQRERDDRDEARGYRV
jgi:transketolase